MLLNALSADRTDSGTPNSYLFSWNLTLGTVAGTDVANDIAPCLLNLHLCNVVLVNLWVDAS